MKTIIFDFDHTIFDTKTFKEFLDSLIKKAGISDEIARTAENNFRENNYNNYDFSGHLDEIKNLGSNFEESLYKSLKNLDLSKYVKEGVKETIEKLKSGNRILLLTKGIIDFQNIKLKQSGISELFGTSIIVCNKEKEKVIERINPDIKNTYFINDSIPEIDTVKKNFPEIKCVVVKRVDIDYTKLFLNPEYKIVEKISEIIDFIK